MTATEFEALKPLIGISESRQDAARMALVDGQTLQAIANIYGLTRQAVGNSVSAVWTVYERLQESQRTIAAGSDEIPSGWEKVVLVAPTELVAKFRAEIAQVSGSTPAKMPAPRSKIERQSNRQKK